jgi:hypothetical protein
MTQCWLLRHFTLQPIVRRGHIPEMPLTVQGLATLPYGDDDQHSANSSHTVVAVHAAN